MLFAARQVQEKCREENLDLYMVFVDLTEALDSVSREGRFVVILNFKGQLLVIRWPSQIFLTFNLFAVFHDTEESEGKYSIYSVLSTADQSYRRIFADVFVYIFAP